MSKSKIKTIMKDHLGENPSLDNVIDHLYESNLSCGNRLTAYELKYEFKKMKEKNPSKSDRDIILQLSADYNISWISAYRYIKQ